MQRRQARRLTVAATPMSAACIAFEAFENDEQFGDAVERLMETTRHLRRGEMGLEVQIGNNCDARQINIDGPTALTTEFMGYVADAGFVVTVVRPMASMMALAA
jgi:7-keto-8-aminopelargonate synthetase-like enzyme